MKPTLLFILLIFSFLINAQEKIEANVLLSYTKSSKVKRFCAASIKSQSLLFIIDGIHYSDDEVPDLTQLDTDNIKEIKVLKDSKILNHFCNSDYDGIIVINTKQNGIVSDIEKEYPFKVYKVCNADWAIPQDMYNAIRAKVPGVVVKNTSNTAIPEIRMRGDDNTIVIVDGIRYDASILNTLNPSDIESLKVSNNPAAQNYFINN